MFFKWSFYFKIISFQYFFFGGILRGLGYWGGSRTAHTWHGDNQTVCNKSNSANSRETPEHKKTPGGLIKPPGVEIDLEAELTLYYFLIFLRATIAAPIMPVPSSTSVPGSGASGGVSLS